MILHDGHAIGHRMRCLVCQGGIKTLRRASCTLMHLRYKVQKSWESEQVSAFFKAEVKEGKKCSSACPSALDKKRRWRCPYTAIIVSYERQQRAVLPALSHRDLSIYSLYSYLPIPSGRKHYRLSRTSWNRPSYHTSMKLTAWPLIAVSSALVFLLQ